MSQGELLNSLFNETLGWDDLEAEVYYGQVENPYTGEWESAWYINAPVLSSPFRLGANANEAFHNMVDFSEDFRVMARKLTEVKDRSASEFLNKYFQRVDLNMSPTDYFPELSKSKVVEVPVGRGKLLAYSCLSALVACIVLLVLCPGL